MASSNIKPLQQLLLRSSNEPVSPINTLAVFRLNIKNPKHDPTIILPKTITSFTSKIIAITVKHVAIIADILVLNPSIPSVKFIAFVVPNITNITKGIYKSIGNTIYFLAKGINVSVPKCIPLVKYNVYATEIISNPSILYAGFNPFVSLKTNFLKSSIKPIVPNPIVINSNGRIFLAVSGSLVL